MKSRWDFDEYVKVLKEVDKDHLRLDYYEVDERGVVNNTKTLLTDNPPNYIKEAMALLDLQNEIDGVGYKIRMDITTNVYYKIKRK